MAETKKERQIPLARKDRHKDPWNPCLLASVKLENMVVNETGNPEIRKKRKTKGKKGEEKIKRPVCISACDIVNQRNYSSVLSSH